MENNLFTTVLCSVGFLTRIDFEAVDLTRAKHRTALYETLCEFGTPKDIARQLMDSVERIVEDNNASQNSREERDKLGLKHIAYGFYSKDGKTPVTHKRDGDTFVTATDAEYEDVAKQHGEEGERSAPIADPSSDDDSSEGEGEMEQPPAPVQPRPGDSEEAKKAAEAGNVAAELAVAYAEELKSAEEESEEDVEL